MKSTAPMGTAFRNLRYLPEASDPGAAAKASKFKSSKTAAMSTRDPGVQGIRHRGRHPRYGLRRRGRPERAPALQAAQAQERLPASPHGGGGGGSDD